MPTVDCSAKASHNTLVSAITTNPVHRVPRSRLRRVAARALQVLVISYLTLILLFSLFQDRMVFSGSLLGHESWRMVQPTPDTELIKLKTSVADPLIIQLGKALNTDGSIRSDSGDCPTLLFFYGGGGTLSEVVELCRRWRSLGANVVGVEYPGYGMSEGKASETSFYSAAEQVHDYLRGRADLSHSRIIAVGQSLGTGVATELAMRRKVAGVVLVSPYTRMADMARIRAPYIPTSLILKHHFRTDEKIPQLNVPILIVHGTHDSMIPIHMAQQLAALNPQHARAVYVDADHVDLLEHAKVETDAALGALIQSIKGAP